MNANGTDDLRATNIRRLVDEVCPSSPQHPQQQSHPPLDLRLGPTLPPDAVIAAARGAFDDLGDLKGDFDGLRDRLSSALRACANAKRVVEHAHAHARPTHAASHMQPGQPGQPGQPAAPGAAGALLSAFSFAHCVLQAKDPMLPLRSAADVAARVTEFVESTAAAVLADPAKVANAYCARGGARQERATPAEVLESLRDPVSALSDDGLCNAMIQHVTDGLGLAVVVRKGVGAECMVCLGLGGLGCLGGSDATPAVFVDWLQPQQQQQQQRPRFELVRSCGSTLGDIRRHLFAEGGYDADDGALAPRRKGAPPPTLQELAHVAACCAVTPAAAAAAGASWRSRAQVLTKLLLYPPLRGG